MAGMIQIGYSGSAYGQYQTGLGGEFTLNPLSGWLDMSGYVAGTTMDIGVAGTFQTFCIEVNEHISGYSATYNAQLNTNAMYGSVNPPGDPVSAGTGWLYSQFAQGTLAGYDYGAGRLVSAAALQNTIWWLEGEAGDPGAGNVIRQAVLANFGDSAAAAMADGGWQYGVYALNLWTGSDPTQNRNQDQLFYVPDGGMTLMLLGGALMGLGALRRKFDAW
jgi:hypothetical protein